MSVRNIDDHNLKRLRDFVIGSNAIESIWREPTDLEIDAHRELLSRERITLVAVRAFHGLIAPGKPLRDKYGMDVRVGDYVAPGGGPGIYGELETLLAEVNTSTNPWLMHVKFEALHPFMDGNGRTGRALWAWQMQRIGFDPLTLPFLHRFYYQTLENARA